jgi:hypothetical protein
MDRQYKDQKKHGQTIQRPKETWTGNTKTKRNMDSVSFGLCIACPCFFWSLYCLSMFLLVVVLPVHVSFGRWKHGQAIQRPKEAWTDNTTTKRNMDSQYNDQKKHGQAIQLPQETWTDNTTTKRNMDRQYNDKKYCLSMFLLVVVFFDNVSFDHCIACPCFFLSLYCLSMFLFVVVLPVHVSFGRWKHGQTIQRPKEAWTDNTTTKRDMVVVVLSVYIFVGRCIACPCFFLSLYCLSMFLLVVVLSVHVSFGHNTTTKRDMDRQYKDQKKHGQAIQLPKET